MISHKIREILDNNSLSLADKLIEIDKLTKIEEPELISTPFGAAYMDGKTLVIDGRLNGTVVYTDTPRLAHKEEIYYSGGCTWGVDLDGKRYHKLYNSFDDNFNHRRGDKDFRKEFFSHEDPYNFDEWLKKKLVKLIKELNLNI